MTLHVPPSSAWPFGQLRPFGYDVIMADPPWSFDNWSEKGEAKNPKAHYACMPTAAIAALPVGHLARGDCWLWLWATWPMLPDALDVMRAWGFRYSCGGSWTKRGASGKLAFGPGYITRTCSEVYLIGKIGSPRTHSRSIRNLIEAPRREHSRKPDQAYRDCETLFGPAFRADLFSRQVRPGWDAFGFETDHFPPAAVPTPAAPILLDLEVSDVA